MYGAIIGDIAGSIYEFSQLRGIKNIECETLIPENGFFSDDSILTVAILDAILQKKDYEESLKKYGKDFIDYKPDFSPYFKTSFSPGFIKWVNGNYQGTSTGNGAMMRISPVGYLFDTEEDVVKNAYLATSPSHNSKEAIDSATIIAMIIFLSRKGYSKEEIIKKLNIDLKYKDFTKFNTTCQETLDNCLYAFFTSNSFDESIKKVISYGGDTDTNACIVGSMSEAMYGLDENLIQEVNKKIPQSFVKTLKKGYQNIRR